MRRHILAAPAGLLIALLLIPAGGPRADDANAAASANGIEVIDYGIYSLTVTRRVPAPDDVSLERNIVANVKVLRKDRVIAAQPGRSFGYQFRVTDPALAGRRITLRTTFPELTNPDTGKRSSSQERTIVAQVGAPIYDGYRFDYRWEMAEGIWRFQVLVDGKLISDQRFKIVVPLN